MKKGINTEEVYAVQILKKGYLDREGLIIPDILRAEYHTEVERAESKADIYNSWNETEDAVIRVLHIVNKGILKEGE
ncbi:hypothetical protein [Paenibacillus sp. FSL H3-0286]|uniref:hypothetical protein n=1 Tax=Paenibacillus sp. FSL H3-0286 TaxID=2921427 RepID=UPI0032519537